MATIAVFIAIGGGAYAASQIKGSQIKKYSVPGNRLKKDAVVPAAETVQSLHLSSAGSKGHKRVAMAASGGRTGSLVQIPAGQSAEVLETAPYTVSASCTDSGGGRFTFEETVTSSQDGWISSTDPVEHQAGDQVRLMSFVTSEGPVLGNSSGFTSPWLANVGAGTAVTLSSPSVTVIDGVCLINQFAIG